MVKDLLAPFGDKWPEGSNFNMEHGEKVTAFDSNGNQILAAPPVKLRCFSTFTACKSLLLATHLDMTRPRAHAEPLLFSLIVHLKPAHFENGFLGGNIVKSEGLSPLPCVPNTHESYSTILRVFPRKQRSERGCHTVPMRYPNTHEPYSTSQTIPTKQ